MRLSREELLRRTHGGLWIYSRILQHYYPGELLRLGGHRCVTTRNPFSGGSLTLSIVQDPQGCFRFADLANPALQGDPFDFANLHFHLPEPELLAELTTLFVTRPTRAAAAAPVMVREEEPPFDPPRCSFFHGPVSNTRPSDELTLVQIYRLIRGDHYAALTQQLRAIGDPAEARRFKASHFDYVTFSGTFTKRSDAGLKQPSGLLTLDFDHLSHREALRLRLLDDPCLNTALLFTSPSGDGLKWIIPIDPEQAPHARYFAAVANYIQHTYGCAVDRSGRDLSRACFLCCDPQVFIHPHYLKP